MESVYLETSFISLLVGNPSRDLVTAANYLLTWNCRHLANAQILGRLEAEAERLGWKLPKVCTPLELMGDFSYETGPDP